MAGAAHLRFLGVEGLAGLLVLVVRGAVQGGGYGGIGAGGQRQAEDRAVHPGRLAGGSCPVQDAGEQAARAGGVLVREVGEAQVHFRGGGQVVVAVGVGDLEGVLKVGQGGRELPRGDLVDAEVHQGDGERVAVAGRPREGEDLLVVGEGRVQVTGLGLEYGAVAEGDGDPGGITGCPGQRDGLVCPGQGSGQVALQVAEPVERGESVGGQVVVGEGAGDRDGLPGHRGDVRAAVEVGEQLAVRDQGNGQGAGRLAGIGAREHGGERLDDLAAVAAGEDEPAQAGGQAQAWFWAGGVGDAEGQRGTDVVELGLDPVQPAVFVRTAQLGGGGLDEGQVVVAVGGADVGGADLG